MATLTDRLTKAVDTYQTGIDFFDEEMVPLDNLRQPEQQYVEAAPIEPVRPKQFGVVGQETLAQPGPLNRNYMEEAAIEGWGESRFDRGAFTPGRDIEDIRAREQSWGNKVLNGAMKGLVTAGTTFGNTTAGTVAGAFRLTPAGSLVYGLSGAEGDMLEQAVNNPVSTWLNSVQRSMEEVLPNYQTEEERSEDYQREWYRPSHWISGNFIGDSFLKNFGFTAGAMLGGMAWSKLLGAIPANKLSSDVMKGVATAASGDAEAASGMKAVGDALRSGVAVADSKAVVDAASKAASRAFWQPFSRQTQIALIGALGEGNAEGLMARQEFLDEYMPQLNQQFSEDLKSIEQELLQDSRYTSEDGPGLNAAGMQELMFRQNSLYEKYQMLNDQAKAQADELAKTTFLLNIPILTVSNIIQFSRMLGGGWRSAKSAAGGVRGGLDFENGIPVGKYKTTPGGLRVAANIAKISGAEATEEMLQGFASSGATQIADDRLTYFNDVAYDEKAVNGVRDWLVSMSQGGRDYLGDIKNWQEGFLGALTGLLGIPGKGYLRGERGGVIGAIKEAKETNSAEGQAAEMLNNLVNSQQFRDRWDGYIRHQKFDDDIRNAVARDDEYAFHNADDAMLFSDVMTFAKAGKLNDLLTVADRFSNLSADDIKDIREQYKQDNGTEDKRLDKEIKASVEEQANRIKKTVEEYDRMRGEMLARLPVGASEKIVDETTFTANQIARAEERFLGIMDKTLNSLDAIIGSKINKPEGSDEFVAELDRIKNRYAKIFSGSLFSVDAATRAKDNDALDRLQNLVRNDKTLSKQVSDMRKLYQDRQKFFDKLLKLESMPEEEYNEQAKTQAKVQEQNTQKARETEAKDYLSKLDEKVGGVDSVEQMHRIYNDPQTNRGAFVDAIRQKAKSGDQAANDFVKLYDTYYDFREALAKKHPEIVNKTTGNFSIVAEILLDQMFNGSNSDSQFVTSLEGLAFDPNEVSLALQTMVESGQITEDEALPLMVNKQLDDAMKAIGDTAEDFRNSWNSTTGRQNLKTNKKEEKPQTPVDDNANPQAATKPDAKPADTQKVKPQEEKLGQAATEKKEENIPEPVSSPTSSDVASDANSSYEDESPLEADTIIADGKGSVKYGFYQQSIPEIATSAAKEIRSLLLQRKNASKEEMEVIDASLAAHPMADFVEFDENGKVIGGEEGYADTYKWLKDNGAFEYISTKLDVNDEVVFAVMEGVPEYQGQKQIVVGVVKERNENGEITQVQPLTILHSAEKSGDYMNLDDLYDAIYTDYESREPDGSLYVFGGKTNPKTSRVWGKRPGVVRYNHKDGGRSINNIDAYDPNAPIMVIDENNEPVLLRGNIGDAKIYMPNIYEWSGNHYGRLYYLVKSGDNGYTPIFVDKKGVTSDDIGHINGNLYLQNINGIASQINVITEKLTPNNIDASNVMLKTQLKALNELINLDGIEFNYVYNEVPYLEIKWGDSENQMVQLAVGESIFPLFDNVLNRPPRLSPKNKWLASSKKNLSDIIDAGLLTSDARELRQVGVNFMYDPWVNGSFKRVLPSSADNSNKAIPKAEPQHIAKDAELDDNLLGFMVKMPDNFTVPESAPKQTEVPQDLNGFFDEKEDAVAPKYELDLDYDQLSETSRGILASKKITEKNWEDADTALREKYLYC